MRTLLLRTNLLVQNKALAFVIAFIFIFSSFANAQQGKSKASKHHEIAEDPYMAPNAESGTSPAYQKQSSLVFTTQVNINSDGENIIGDAGNEPSLAIDPTNPNRMFIGWRQFDNVASNFRQAGYAYTLDAGETWTFPGVIEPGIFRSDPVLDTDAEGNIYYNSLTADEDNNFWCHVFRITDGGLNWDAGTYAQGGDKQWMHIDKYSENGMGNNYSFWTSYWSICYPGAFTRSTDGGDSYEDCVVTDGGPYWGTLATGPDGTLYIVGASDYDGGIMVAKSTNAQYAVSTVSWDSYANVNMGGELSAWTDVNPSGLLGQAYIDVDQYNGNVYILAAIKPFNSDPGEIMFSKSTDGGINWEAPTRINDDPTNSNNTQWFGTMSVAPNGRIDIVWLDTRDNPGSVISALYYSYSVDQGVSWSPNEKISDSFHPHVGWPNQEKMGDYYEMISDDGGAHLAWANTLNGEQDVYYSHIIPQFTGIRNNARKQTISVTTYPNPFTDKATIRYELKESGNVHIAIYDVYGKQVKLLLNNEQSAGIYNLQLEASHLPEGIYFCKLNSGRQFESVQMVLIK
jgi:hypothetical protein